MGIDYVIEAEQDIKIWMFVSPSARIHDIRREAGVKLCFPFLNVKLDSKLDNKVTNQSKSNINKHQIQEKEQTGQISLSNFGIRKN